MTKNFRLAYKGSPFIPIIDVSGLISTIKYDVLKGFPPSAAIALAITDIMEIHLTAIQHDQDLILEYELDTQKLQLLNLGYRYPLDTILASAICYKVPPEEQQPIYEEMVKTSHNFLILRVQDQISQDLRATVNLFKMDPSSAPIFQYLKDYPVFSAEEFLNGMEIAATLFFGLALALVDSTGDDSWLNTPYDPTNLG